MEGLDVIVEDQRWKGLETLALRTIPASLIHLELNPDSFEVAVLGCNDQRIAELNQDFRDKPQATNVLSWPAIELAASVEGELPGDPGIELGDIAISFETCKKEAAEQGKVFEDHVCHLLAHGLLHLLGYDHIRDGDAALMENIETEILGKLGITNPY